MENPFAGLRPEMRSEHDEIRKGIFSRALRNMQFSPLAERREWCRAIRATYAATQAARQKRAAATSGTKSSDDGSGASGGTASPSASPEVGTKRTHDAAQLTDGPTSSGKSTGGVETAETPLATSTASPPTTQGLATDGDAGGDEEEEESEASVKECIAAYLRSLLDRVVGVSLENLNVPALRILCTMVGIHTEVRNKIGLYSTLASFYYTECEKLGKRVSKDTIFERQAAQEAAMLRRLPASTNANAASSSSATKRGGEKMSTPQQQQQQNKSTTEAKAASSRSASGKASPAAVVVSVTSHRRGENAVGGSQGKEKEKPSSRSTSTKAEQQQPAAAAAAAGLTHYLKYENATEAWEAEDAEGTKPQSSLHASHNHPNSAYGGGEEVDGEVVYEERVFARRGGASTASSSSSPHMTKYASSAGEDDGWSAPMVERKIASIVQLHDPVTVAIVVKKLAQLGYRAGNVEATVEQVLRRFHDRQLIFYDNGIAYLM